MVRRWAGLVSEATRVGSKFRRLVSSALSMRTLSRPATFPRLPRAFAETMPRARESFRPMLVLPVVRREAISLSDRGGLDESPASALVSGPENWAVTV